MEPISYKNHYTVSRETYKEWDRLHVLKSKRDMIFQGIWAVLALAALYMFIYTLRAGNGYPVLALVVLALCAFRGLILPPLRARGFREMVIKKVGKDQWERNILFGGRITFLENQKTSEFSYGQIREVREYESWYAVLLEGGGIIYVSRKGFTVGNPDNFMEWLLEKSAAARKSEVEAE